MKARIRNDALDVTKIIWDLCLLVTLNKKCGFGNKRLTEFYKELEDTQAEFTRDACVTDRQGRRESHTDITTAVIKMIRAAESRDIDWKKILGVERLVVGGKDVTQR